MLALEAKLADRAGPGCQAQALGASSSASSYPASEIEDYLARFEAAVAAKRRQVRLALPPILGFQSWRASATPLEHWQFSIQRDGRPMDLCAAIIAGKLTGKAEALTIREFCDRVADAASRAFHQAEARALDRVTPKAKMAPSVRRSA